MMPRPSPTKIVASESGQGIIMVLVASITLLIALLALASSISYVQTMNSAAERRTSAEDFVRAKLQTMKGTIEYAGGVTPFIRNFEPGFSIYNPIVTVNFNDPLTFKQAFGFDIISDQTFHNVPYTATFSVKEFKFDAALNAQPFLLNTDDLRDLAYIQFTVDLLPKDPTKAGNGTDGPLARHGEIYVAK